LLHQPNVNVISLIPTKCKCNQLVAPTKCKCNQLVAPTKCKCNQLDTNQM
jgi:hypothetical protein